MWDETQRTKDTKEINLTRSTAVSTSSMLSTYKVENICI